jgi:hypothetical protein
MLSSAVSSMLDKFGSLGDAGNFNGADAHPTLSRYSAMCNSDLREITNNRRVSEHSVHALDTISRIAQHANFKGTCILNPSL